MRSGRAVATVMRGPGIKLEGRDRDRVVSDYLELLGARHPHARTIPGAPLIAFLIAAIAVVPLIAALIWQWLPGSPWWSFAAFLAVATVVSAVFVLFATGVIGPRRRVWYAAMRRCGHDVCVICGYALERRAPDSRACPECGTSDRDQPVPLGPRASAPTWPRYDVDADERVERAGREDRGERDSSGGS